MTSVPFYQFDAFAEKPFGGNQAAVMLMDGVPFDDALLQTIGAENNVAETAFLWSRPEGSYDLRWFTPAVEVPLCGHATLASAAALIAHFGPPVSPLVFHTKSGPLTVSTLPDGRLEMDFPTQNSTAIAIPAGLGAALGAEPIAVYAGAFLCPILASAADVRALKPDHDALKAIATPLLPGWPMICVSAAADVPGFDVVSRFFARGAGIDEDPATGSAHCALAPIWSARLGRDQLYCFQAYPGRGAVVETALRGDRVLLRGRARLVIKGMFEV